MHGNRDSAIKVKKLTTAAEQRVLCGKLIVLNRPISYLGEVNPKEGTILGSIHIKDAILVYKGGIGSTVGSYMIYGLSVEGNKPKALVVTNPDVVTVAGSVLADIPLYVISDNDMNRLLESLPGSNVEACIENQNDTAVLRIGRQVNST